MASRELGGVVDCDLKVYGTKNLRIGEILIERHIQLRMSYSTSVVDASVIPLQLGATPQATIYAFAEKVAQSLLMLTLLISLISCYIQAADIIKAALK